MADPFDAETFTQAFAQSGRMLWVLACAWVGRDEAEDLVQETARVAWQRRGSFVGGDTGAWLATIARQLGANWRRKRRPEPRANEDLPPAVVDARSVTGDWPFDADRAGLSDGLARALAGLGEVPRACLLLRVVLDMGFAEIGTMLGVPENTAQSHARRARLALNRALSRSADAPAR